MYFEWSETLRRATYLLLSYKIISSLCNKESCRTCSVWKLYRSHIRLIKSPLLFGNTLWIYRLRCQILIHSCSIKSWKYLKTNNFKFCECDPPHLYFFVHIFIIKTVCYRVALGQPFWKSQHKQTYQLRSF